ncbi:hypothetical protein FS150101_NMOIFPPK_01345 [Fructilactobacillus sanfranciscensis]|uniref:hypothetical protein n=1 Tax=Fructilactobacillus sanfranciscensis TaxID=1625 RepID=UPI00384EF090
MVTAFSESIYRTTVDKRYGLLALKLQGGIKPFYYVFGGGIFMEISIFNSVFNFVSCSNVI